MIKRAWLRVTWNVSLVHFLVIAPVDFIIITDAAFPYRCLALNSSLSTTIQTSVQSFWDFKYGALFSGQTKVYFVSVVLRQLEACGRVCCSAATLLNLGLLTLHREVCFPLSRADKI